MKTIGVIPARYASTRLKAKVLVRILEKPMIQHVWERARKSRLLDELIIACDDERVFEAAESFGARAVMTSRHHISGTERIAEAVRSLNAEIVVNIQGDEPLLHLSMIDDMIKALVRDKTCVMSTVIKPIDKKEELTNPNVVKVVIDRNDFALYFSRSMIPFNRDEGLLKGIIYYKHLGLYAYRKSFLMGFKNLPLSPLEKTERLEQLRVLEAGFKIKTVKTSYDTIAVDTLQDVHRVARFLKRKGARG